MSVQCSAKRAMAAVGSRQSAVASFLRHRRAPYSTPSRPVQATLSKDPVRLGAPPPPPPPLASQQGSSKGREVAGRPPTSGSSEVVVTHHQDLTLSVDAPQHGLHDARFTYVWLRDSCQGPESVDPGSRQKIHRSSDVPPDVFPLDTSLVKSSEDGGETSLRVVWSAPLLPEQRLAADMVEAEDKAKLQSGQTPSTIVTAFEPTVSVFPLSFLAQYATPTAWDGRHRSEALRPLLWAKDDLAAQPDRQLHIPYADFLRSDDVQYAALRQLVQRGLVFFEGVSPDKKSGWATELKTLVERMGEMRRTFYGDLWDVRSEGKTAINVAYTNANLDLHADLVHFQNPPRYQLLHCLRNRVSGGLSTFADAFRTSALLLQADPDAFSLLASHPIPFEYVNPHSGHHTSWARPTIELKDGWTSQDVIDQPELLPEALMAVNYAPPFQGPLLTHPPSGPPRLREQAYGPARQAAIRQALSDWVSLLEREEERWTCRLEEGQCVAFDNRRVLHARTAFEEQSGPAGEVSADEEEPQVKRWLKGAYVEGDSVWDRLRVLDRKFGPSR